MTFVDFVKEVRKNMEMSQHKFAKAINVSYTTLNRWERNRIVPSRLARKSFFEFCKLYDIDVPNEVYEKNEFS
jgi:DNA-binding XRE family transcriptional regulator